MMHTGMSSEATMMMMCTDVMSHSVVRSTKSNWTKPMAVMRSMKAWTRRIYKRSNKWANDRTSDMMVMMRRRMVVQHCTNRSNSTHSDANNRSDQRSDARTVMMMMGRRVSVKHSLMSFELVMRVLL